jgi:circadian clock protein KaiB
MKENGKLKYNRKIKDAERFVLRLFVTGASPNSMRAIANIKNICEGHFNKNYDLEIIDVYQQPVIAKQENIIALPLLIKKFPLPEKRLIGDMSNIQKVLSSFGVLNDDQ